MPQFHSEHRHIGYGMREQHPNPLMDIHPDTAQELGIADGDWVWIEGINTLHGRGLNRSAKKLAQWIVKFKNHRLFFG